jgi:Fe-Mn family superoxide dismutase
MIFPDGGTGASIREDHALNPSGCGRAGEPRAAVTRSPGGTPPLSPFLAIGARAMDVQVKSPFQLPPLPYDQGALAPVISAETMGFHYGKHHKAYVDKLNELVEGSEFQKMTLEDIVKATYKASDPKKSVVFNNAGQIWNHTFFWASLTPNATQLQGNLAKAIERDLGGLAKFKDEFAKAGVGQFGSGWVWLVSDKGKLAIEKTPNAETPMAAGKACLLTIDVWEHAYYLDYQNRRADFLKEVIDKRLNWDFARQNFERAG